MSTARERINKKEKARHRADRKAFNQLPNEAKTEFESSVGEAMERFNDSFDETRSDFSDTYGQEARALISKYGLEAVRYFLEHTRSDRVNVSLMDFFWDEIE
jgi:hypothetical protein